MQILRFYFVGRSRYLCICVVKPYTIKSKDTNYIFVISVCALAIPYTIKVTTGGEEDMGTEANIFVTIIGGKKKQTTGTSMGT